MTTLNKVVEYHKCAKASPTCCGLSKGISGYHACAKLKKCGVNSAKPKPKPKPKKSLEERVKIRLSKIKKSKELKPKVIPKIKEENKINTEPKTDKKNLSYQIDNKALIDEWDSEYSLPILFYQQFKNPSIILNDIQKIAKKGMIEPVQYFQSHYPDLFNDLILHFGKQNKWKELYDGLVFIINYTLDDSYTENIVKYDIDLFKYTKYLNKSSKNIILKNIINKQKNKDTYLNEMKELNDENDKLIKSYEQKRDSKEINFRDFGKLTDKNRKKHIKDRKKIIKKYGMEDEENERIRKEKEENDRFMAKLKEQMNRDKRKRDKPIKF